MRMPLPRHIEQEVSKTINIQLQGFDEFLKEVSKTDGSIESLKKRIARIEDFEKQVNDILSKTPHIKENLLARIDELDHTATKRVIITYTDPIDRKLIRLRVIQMPSSFFNDEQELTVGKLLNNKVREIYSANFLDKEEALTKLKEYYIEETFLFDEANIIIQNVAYDTVDKAPNFI